MTTWRTITLDTDNATGDAFSRLRTANPETLFDSKQIFDNQPLFWDDQEVSGSGTSSAHSSNAARTRLSIGATTAGRRVRQTFQSFNYQPGKSQWILMTGVLYAGGSGITKYMGYGNDKNGVFLKQKDGIVSVVVRSYVTGSAVDTEYAQDVWNVDGMGDAGNDLNPSEITEDWGKSLIFAVDMEWLGVGRVRFALVINGKVYYFHLVNHANSLDVVYMSTPNLPLRYEIENDGTGAADNLDHICTSVMSEGGSQDLGIVRSASTAGTEVVCTSENTIYAIIGIRLKAAYIGAVVKLLSAAVQIQTASETGEWRLYLNPTVASTFTYADETNSAIQSAKGATANTVTGGTEIGGGFGGSGGNQAGAQGDLDSSLKTSRYLGASIDGAVDEIVLCWIPNGGTAAHDVEGSLSWREL